MNTNDVVTRLDVSKLLSFIDSPGKARKEQCELVRRPGRAVSDVECQDIPIIDVLSPLLGWITRTHDEGMHARGQVQLANVRMMYCQHHDRKQLW